MAGITQRLLTQNPLIDSIAGNIIWDTKTLNYSFVSSVNEARIFSEIPRDSDGVFRSLEKNDEHNFKSSVIQAFDAFERVTNLKFNPVEGLGDADLKVAGLDGYYTSIGSTAGTADLPGDNPVPGASSNFESYVLLNTNLSTALLAAEVGGANSFLSTTLHELGHALGLDHPHDARKSTIPITGVGFQDPNDIPIDNRRYTLLSYEDGGLNVLYGRGYGHPAGPSAIDIAALHAMYGANPTTNKTNTIYKLTEPKTTPLDVDGNDGLVQIGRTFFTIWDTGGLDAIVYEATNNVVLNLNSATLGVGSAAVTRQWMTQVQAAKHYDALPSEFQDEIEDVGYHAGGLFSRIFRNASSTGYDLGGFSIAKGATIENAIASSGNDFLIGNTVNNRLEAQAGEDFLHGSLGDDTLDGGDGNDELYGGAGDDLLKSGAGEDYLELGTGQDTVQGTVDELDGDRIKDFAVGDEIVITGAQFSGITLETVGDLTTLSFAEAGNSLSLTLMGAFNQHVFSVSPDPSAPGQNTVISVSQLQPNPAFNSMTGTIHDDQLMGGATDDYLNGKRGDDVLLGNDGNDRLIGDRGDDVMMGGAGNDRFVGGEGFDSLTGGAGADKFVFQNSRQMVDTIVDFEVNKDILLLRGARFGLGVRRNFVAPFRFTVGAGASNPQQRLIYNQVDGQLWFDADGSGSKNAILFAQFDPMLNLSHSDFHVMKY